MDGPIGYGWSHSFSFTLYQSAGGNENRIKVMDNTGRGYYFQDYDNDSVFEGEFLETSSGMVGPGGNYVWEHNNFSYEFDSATGLLLSISGPKGNTHILSYDTTGMLQTVTDTASGRSLSFTYNQDNKIAYISGPVTPAVPDGIWVSYEYDTSGNLIRVTYADDNNGSPASGFEYRYEDPDDPHNMTAKYDLAGNLISTWAYDDQDRAIENVNREGKGADITYTDDTHVAVTDAYGITSTYGISEIAGRKKITGKTYSNNCTSCSGGIARTAFDETTGFPVEREYFNGRMDQFQNYDAKGNPGTRIISQGTPEEKIIYTTYHPALSTPLTLTQKSQADAGNPDRTHVSIWDYDDPNGSGSGSAPNEAPTTRIYRYIEQGYTQDNAGAIIPFEHITAYTYNAKGQVTSVNGPLPGDQDIILFAYDPTTGDLLAVTRPILGTRTFEYDGAGNLSRTVDENNIQTLFSYDGKNRLTQTIRDGVVSSQTYTTAGSVSGQTDGAGRTLTYAYNPKGFLQKIMNPAGEYLYYSYDENGNRIEESIYSAQGC